MTEPGTTLREKDDALRCTSRFAGCRCHLRSGHRGEHFHDGAAGVIRWGKRRVAQR